MVLIRNIHFDLIDTFFTKNTILDFVNIKFSRTFMDTTIFSKTIYSLMEDIEFGSFLIKYIYIYIDNYFSV